MRLALGQPKNRRGLQSALGVPAMTLMFAFARRFESSKVKSMFMSFDLPYCPQGEYFFSACRSSNLQACGQCMTLPETQLSPV